MAYTVPPLPYPFDALEPHIDAQTMEIHHDKHHAAYVDQSEQGAWKAPTSAISQSRQLIAKLDRCRRKFAPTVRNNGGGHANHSLFWTIMGKGKGAARRASWPPPSRPSWAASKTFSRSLRQSRHDPVRQRLGVALVDGKTGKLAVENTAQPGQPADGQATRRCLGSTFGSTPIT